MKTIIEGGKAILFPEGRIDSTNAPLLQKALDDARGSAPEAEPVVDCEHLSYISSAGLRVLLNLSKKLGKPLTVRNVSREVYDIFDTTGFTSLLHIVRRPRELSVEGCEIIGRGAYGTVYRLDDDTIVKVYESPDALPIIENEQRLAKLAFIKGVPTAISYDLVRVGSRYGSVFEMVKARTCNDLIVAEPDRAEEILRQYAGIIRKVHGVAMERGELPDARAVFAGYLDELRAVLPPAMEARLTDLIGAMPENLHLIHGDIHMKNVMFSEDEPLLIDMETLAVGDPVFEFAGLFVAYHAFLEDEPDNSLRFMGIPADMSESIWRGLLRHYLGQPDEGLFRAALDRVAVAGYVRFLVLIAKGVGAPALKDIRIRHTLERLEALLPRVERLEL